MAIGSQPAGQNDLLLTIRPGLMHLHQVDGVGALGREAGCDLPLARCTPAARYLAGEKGLLAHVVFGNQGATYRLGAPVAGCGIHQAGAAVDQGLQHLTQRL